jgi:hypothetical protein
MKLTIQRGDVRVEVEGEDAIKVLQHMGMLTPGNSAQHSSTHFAATKTTISAEAQTQQDRFRRFYKTLSPTPRLVLQQLAKFPEGATDVQLKESLRSHNITTLAGAMTAIVKGAKRMNMDLESVLIKETFRNRETNSYFLYRLGSVAKEFIEAEASQEMERNGRGFAGATK